MLATKPKKTKKTAKIQEDLTDSNFTIDIPDYLIIVMSPGRPRKILLADSFSDLQQKVSDAKLKDKYAVFYVFNYDIVYSESFNNMIPTIGKTGKNKV